MVLYEDLRIYTIWRTEMAQSKQQSLDYKKTASEWEILGDLAQRLHHFEESIEAYKECMSIRFSPRAKRGILKLYEQQGDTRSMLNALIRLIAWQYKWYSEVSPSFFFFPLLRFYLTNTRNIPFNLCTRIYVSLTTVLFFSNRTVFTRAIIPHSQTHRRRRSCKSTQYRTSH